MTKKILKLKKILSENPSDIGVLLELAWEFEKMGNDYRARKYLKKVLRFQPENRSAISLLQAVELRCLIQKYSSFKSFYKWQDALARGRAGDPTVVDDLIKGLKDRNKWVRKECALALAMINTEKALGALAMVAGQRDIAPLVEKTLKKAMDEKPSIHLLRKIMVSNKEVCLDVIIYLGFKKNPEAADALMHLAGDPLEDKWIRGSASWALGQIGDVSALNILRSMMYGDKEEYVREESEQAYHKILDRLQHAPLPKIKSPD